MKNNSFWSGMTYGTMIGILLVSLLIGATTCSDVNKTCKFYGYDNKKSINNEWYCVDPGDEPRIIRLEVLRKMEVCDE